MSDRSNDWSVSITGHPEGAGGQRLYIVAEGGTVAQIYPCGNPRRALGNESQSDMPEAFNGPIMRRRVALIVAAPGTLEALRLARTFMHDDHPAAANIDAAIAKATAA